MSLRLEHATLVDPAPDAAHVRREASLFIDDDRIAEVDGPRVEAEHVIDAAGCIVAPGLVNAHTHAPMTLLRGAADDLTLEAWLRDRIWPLEAHMTAEAVRAGAELAIAEMVAGGVTGFADTYFFEDQVAQAAREAGIRCQAGFPLISHDTPELAEDDQPAAARDFLKRWPADGELVRGGIAPHSTYACDEEGLRLAAELSAKHEAVLQVHCAETRHEVYSVEAETGRRPVAQLAHTGCLTERAWLAHCGWCTKAEVREIARAGAQVTHNPVANAKLGTGGHAPVPEFLVEGVTVGLGTDGPASNNRLDLFETMKTAALFHKHHRWEPALLPAGNVLAMACGHGARLLGLEDGGRIREGAPADLMVVDAQRPHMQPVHDAVSQLVYAARAGDVRATVVAGRVVYEDGAWWTLDVGDVFRRASEHARRIVSS